MTVRSDPGEKIVLASAILLLAGLLLSLTGHRRRIFARVGGTSSGGSTAAGDIELGGLSRGEHPGFPGEFDEIVERIRRA